MEIPGAIDSYSRRLSASSALTKFLGKATNIRMHQILKFVSEEELKGRRTHIVCTMGPSCWDVERLVQQLMERLFQLFDAGLNICRLNFSHGDFESHGNTVNNIREAMKQRPNKQIALMLDTKGPEIRTGMLKDHKSVNLVAGQSLKIVTDYNVEGDSTIVACSYKKLPQSVTKGKRILMADGSLVLTVTDVGADFVVTKLMNSGVLGERKNMNLPGCKVELPVIGEKDKKDIVEFGLPNNIDMIAVSFVQQADDVRQVRQILGPKGAHIKIVSKIENVEGILNFDEILDNTDGVMVARGDMGMEIPPEKVFLAQKLMISKCNVAGKPVITATQMLESMHHNPRPTRAEVADVANAVLDGTDCVMLSGETANGKFPLEAVQVMERVCLEAEACIDYPTLFHAIWSCVPRPVATDEGICAAAVETATDVGATLIIALTETGRTARLLSKYRAAQQSIALTTNPGVARELLLHRGLTPEVVPSFRGTDQVVLTYMAKAKQCKLLEAGDTCVVVHGVAEGAPGGTNLLKVVTVP